MDCSQRVAYSFFKEVIYPFGIKGYEIDNSASSPLVKSGEPLIVDLLIKCINTYKIPRAQVGNKNCICMWHLIKGCVKKVKTKLTNLIFGFATLILVVLNFDNNNRPAKC